jgi:hypothetical protein
MWLQHRQKRLLITVGVVAVVAMWLTVLNRLSCAQPANTPHEVVLGTTKAGDASSLALAGSIEASKLKRKGPFQFNSRSIPLAPAPSTSPDAALTPVPPPAEPSSKWCVDPYPTENRWPSVQEEARDRYDHCRRGSQRCVEWSTATPFSRFPLLETSQWSTDTIAAGKEGTFDPRTRNQLQRMHGLLSATSDDPDAVSNAPYDIDGTPALRTRLREYLATHRAATDFESALAKIESDVASLADAQSVDAKETRARKFARWQKWIAAQRYLLNVDNESGFGNKMLPIISAFAYALLTGRHLILFFPVPGFKDLFTVGPTSPDPSVKPLVTDWNVFLEGLITVTRKLDPTYPVNERGEPKDTEDVDAAAHWTTSVQRRMAETGDTSKPQIKNFHEILALFPQTMLPAVAGGVEAPMYTQAPLDLQAPDSSQAQADMLCNDWLHSPSLTSAWLIRTWSDQYWLPLLAGNELVRPILLGWVNENNMYGPLARFFLNWSPLHVRQRADEFARAHFGTYNIGLQLRRKERVGLRRSEVAGALEGAKALAMLYLGGDPTESSLTPSDLLALRGRRRQVTFFIATDDFASREHWAGVLCPYGHVAFSPTLEYPRDEGTSRTSNTAAGRRNVRRGNLLDLVSAHSSSSSVPSSLSQALATPVTTCPRCRPAPGIVPSVPPRTSWRACRSSSRRD